MTPLELIQNANSVESQGIPVDWNAMCMKVYNSANDALVKLGAEVKELENEVRVLRDYGNKDCTAQADEELGKEPKKPVTK